MHRLRVESMQVPSRILYALEINPIARSIHTLCDVVIACRCLVVPPSGFETLRAANDFQGTAIEWAFVPHQQRDWFRQQPEGAAAQNFLDLRFRPLRRRWHPSVTNFRAIVIYIRRCQHILSTKTGCEQFEKAMKILRRAAGLWK